MTLLTIGIPTYNRAKHLEKLLANILPACEQNSVEVLVSDNCSTDGTQTILQKYGANRALRVVRNGQNLGFDGNILNLLARASGRFLWLMGDDDNLDAGQLPNILQLLKGDSTVGLIYLNYNHTRQWLKRSKNLGLKYSVIDPQVYADRFLHRSTLISTNILQVERARKSRIDQVCVGKGWINIHILLLLLDQLKKDGQQCMAVKNVLVFQGAENNYTPIEPWSKTFVDNLSFTLSKTPLTRITLKGFLKGFYDINIRPKYLTFSEIIQLREPLALYQKIVAMFNPNLGGRMSFMLQYYFSRLLLRSWRRRR